MKLAVGAARKGGTLQAIGEPTTQTPAVASESGAPWEKPFIYIVLAAAIIWAVMRCGLGTHEFSYTLDDPLIHLRLAEQIAHGHYGINASEFSSPSSSILWPFLLAPFALTQIGLYVPLIINIVCSFALVAVGFRAFRGNAALLKVVAILILTNTLGLVVTGMEHSLQVLLAVLCAYGVVETVQQRKCPNWLVVALVAGPLVRYENLFITIPIAILLLIHKWRREALVSLGLAFLFVGGFSLFLLSLGLGVLPNSVVAKSGTKEHSIYQVLIGGPYWNIHDHTMIVAMQAALVFCAFVAFGNVRSFGWIALFTFWLHLTFGRYGWYDRYECYLNGYLLALVLQSKLPIRAPAFVIAVTLSAITSLLPALRYIHRAKSIPFDSRSMATEQLQMHRFAVDYWKRPVAVNDLGWVSWRNPSYVLDLYGLGSSEALKLRLKQPNTDWMEPLCQRHDVGIVMVYETWFGALPKSWIRVAQLTRAGVDDRAVVSFFATTPAFVGPSKAALNQFRPTLPRDSQLKIE